ncbi:MAG: hypothetical protein ACRD2E_01215 [Terriglobales bacterium]
MHAVTAAIPSEWASADEVVHLGAAIVARRRVIRDLIEPVRISPRAALSGGVPKQLRELLLKGE